ncbi:MAG: AAA family ATPase [Acidobacteria bacterium]|nr:AAA family ATPase [Acidobacteriota bacterium]
MSVLIAVAGKGGSGKTTVAAMIVRTLVERTGRSVLAVDADPNACLGLALGVEPRTTIADIREATLDRTLQASPGMDRERAFEYAVQQAVVEARGFDLIAMGLPEGPKCYCAVNHMVRRYLDGAAQDYRYVVLDNEAGMEHLSRRTTDAVDHLVVVAEATAPGALTARRLLGLAARLPITVRGKSVLWNKVTDPAAAAALGEGLPATGQVPYDREVLDASVSGAAVFALGPENPALAAVGRLVDTWTGAAEPPSPEAKER